MDTLSQRLLTCLVDKGRPAPVDELPPVLRPAVPVCAARGWIVLSTRPPEGAGPDTWCRGMPGGRDVLRITDVGRAALAEEISGVAAEGQSSGSTEGAGAGKPQPDRPDEWSQGRTRKEWAKLYGVSTRTFDRLRQRGEVKTKHLGKLIQVHRDSLPASD